MLKLRMDDVRDKRNIPIFELASSTTDLIISCWKTVNDKIAEPPVIVQRKTIMAQIQNLWKLLGSGRQVHQSEERWKRRRKTGEQQTEKDIFLSKLDT